MSTTEYFKLAELPRSVRKYILEDLESPNGNQPVLVLVYSKMFSSESIDMRAMAWLRENDAPAQTFQLFPRSYIVFYDMADVLMFKLAVEYQD